MKLKNESNFKPCPKGVTNSVCVDVVDLGMVSGQYGLKHKLRIVWETSHLIADGPKQGKRFLAMKTYGASLGKKSTLRKDLNSWRGRDLSEDEAREFDLDKVLGASAQLLVVHNVTADATYANVAAVLTATEKMTPTGDYTRVKDRDGYKEPSMATVPETQAHPGDEEGADCPW